jgi:hypothetical protein
MLHLQPRGNADARAFPVRNCIYYFTAPIRAISAGKKLGVRSLTGRAMDEDASAFHRNLPVPGS